MKIKKIIKEQKRADGTIYYFGYVKFIYKILWIITVSEVKSVGHNIKGKPILTVEGYGSPEIEYRFAKENLDEALDKYLKEMKRNEIVEEKEREVI